MGAEPKRFTIPRRPAFWEPATTQFIPGGPDPEQVYEAAHSSAAALVQHGRASDDPAEHARLVRLMQTEGIEDFAQLWSHTAPTSLPGALWRLYCLREWIYQRPTQVYELYRRGQGGEDAEAANGEGAPDAPTAVHHGEISPLAGEEIPAEPEQVKHLIDEIMTGVFTGEVGQVCRRAGALVEVLARGQDAVGKDAQVLARTGRELTQAGRELQEAEGGGPHG
ncbi:MAG: hypothetical protein Q4B12_03995 [Bowdeniella nasicola]|nr:hypothetical protein [Bowdeniella nasicola]